MKKQNMNPEIIKACEAIDAGMPVSEAMRRLNAVKIKGDPLEGWTGSLPFHLDRSPDAPKKKKKKPLWTTTCSAVGVNRISMVSGRKE